MAQGWRLEGCNQPSQSLNLPGGSLDSPCYPREGGGLGSSPENWTAGMEAIYRVYDVDGDRTLTKEEVGQGGWTERQEHKETVKITGNRVDGETDKLTLSGH